MYMRIGGFGGPDWSRLSISIDDAAPPGHDRIRDVDDEEDEDDPFDIDGGDAPDDTACGDDEPDGGDNPMGMGLLPQLFLFLVMLGLHNRGEESPDADDKAKVGGKKRPRLQDDGPERAYGSGDDNDVAAPKRHKTHSQDESNLVGDSGKTGTGNDSDTISSAGSLSKIPAPTGTVTVNETIVVKAGQTFDGGGKLYEAGKNLGDGGQSENQKPVFVLEPGAKLTNLQYKGADGIHTMGDATIKNVWARDVGEDALTMKKYGHVTWSGGGAFNASDKIFQLNAGGSFTLENFTADRFGKAVRTNGGHQIETVITIRNSRFTNGDEAIVRTDSTLATIRMENNMFSDVPNDVLAPSGTAVNGAVKRSSK